ncbi:TonB-dependent receptor [Chitinophaga sp. YIM B06452]|uniref:TonB-dependent receptor n=1 Tax=Chitinophaga sp. YIM B06452 TaxID=3082158 RepID=UPI0031FF2134
MHRISILICLTLCSFSTFAQEALQGRVIDAQTREAISGASILAASGGCLSDRQGEFSLPAVKAKDSIRISIIGYTPVRLAVNQERNMTIYLEPLTTRLNEVIVSAGRDKQYRTDAPVAISSISTQMIRETKATSLEQVLNKVSGVYMVDLGNEQHTMAIRQPIGYRSLFLYLEDGIPIRTTGDFNHNALIEINLAALKTIEVIRGPASSLYGSEAVGGAVNFITASPALLPTARIQAEMSNWGYKRTDFTLSATSGKLGLLVGGYYADQRNGYIDHSDFRKLALTLKGVYRINDRNTWTNAVSYVDYKTDQTGGVDSANFYSRNYKSFHTFSYRLVKAFRVRSTLEHTWNSRNSMNFTAFYRNNEIGQNPFYAIKTTADPLKARGEINSDQFNSYGVLVQHKKEFGWKQASVIAGVSVDYSPATYFAEYIDVDRNAEGYFTGYTSTDSVLTDYRAGLLNTAAYIQAQMNPLERLKLVAALRYDRMDYNFDNHLPPSAFTGSPDERNHFKAWSPKLGLTYDFGRDRGLYANYSVGFAPPNISELYRGVKVPVLKPATYNNYEAGGWFAFAGSKGYVDVSIYRMDGANEIVSVRLADNSSENRNAGKTRHSGVEWNLRYAPVPSLLFRTGGTFAKHEFIEYEDKGKHYGGNRMNGAPEVITNTEVTYKPPFFKGFRVGMEWQHVGQYFMDPANTEKYGGYELLNARAGYTLGGFECWVNCRNITDVMYATTAEKTAFGKSYRPGPNRTFNFGVAYTFTCKQKT